MSHISLEHTRILPPCIRVLLGITSKAAEPLWRLFLESGKEEGGGSTLMQPGPAARLTCGGAEWFQPQSQGIRIVFPSIHFLYQDEESSFAFPVRCCYTVSLDYDGVFGFHIPILFVIQAMSASP